MTALSAAVQAPERAAPAITPDRPPRGLDARLAAVAARMDDRLTLAALAVDVRLPDVGPVDLADVIRAPDQVPPPSVGLYPTPVAAVLQRAHRRLERDGWCAGATVDEDGRRCLYGALRAEATSPAELDAALAVLLETIRRHAPDAQSVPDFNDRYRWAGPRTPLRVLEQAAALAHAR
ncbi:hypothetical protein ACFQWA_00035, partial [Streptomyces thermogriseus]|uniref:DUF6197 family protein n=2 Tax=Streptomyces thermogriseus TaxID=75292 RepID=UPI00360E5FC0